MIRLSTTTIDHLLDTAWDIDRVEAYCMSCKNYDIHFSCPHHQFNIPDFLHQYQHALVAVQTFPIDPNEQSSVTEEFFYHKRVIDQILMEVEANQVGAQAIIPGQCQNCQPECEKSLQATCPNPDLLRYSYESLGFDVSALVRTYFENNLTFEPNQVQLVFGMLTKNRLTDEILNNLKAKLIADDLANRKDLAFEQ